MGRTSAAVRQTTPGKRVGTKRSDLRWRAPDGVVWSSRYEYELYLELKEQEHNVRKTTEKDSMGYASPVRSGRCLQCGSSEVVQQHVYTADLFVDKEGGPNKSKHSSGDGDYHIEAKGYIRAPKRALLRHLRKTRPDVDLRFVVQRDYRVTKQATITEWARKYLKVPAIVWAGRGRSKFPGWGSIGVDK